MIPIFPENAGSKKQVDLLSSYIQMTFEGQPSGPWGAVECAARLLESQKNQIKNLGKEVQRMKDLYLGKCEELHKLRIEYIKTTVPILKEKLFL